jgi:hypothetical protein
LTNTDLEVARRLSGEIAEYVRRRDKADAEEAVAKHARQQADEQRDRLWELMEASGVKTINHDLGRLTRTARLQAIVTDEETLGSYLQEEGLFDAMTKRVYRRANLNGLAADLMEEGRALPEGLDTLSIKGITYTRKK